MVSSASGAARSQKAQSWKGPNTIDTRERAWQKRQKARRDVQRRTRRSASTIGGAAPDTIIGRAAADRAGARPGARPYRATHCENASKWATRFVQRDDGLILRTLSPNFALTPKLQHYRPGCLAVPTDVVRVRNRPSTDVSTLT